MRADLGEGLWYFSVSRRGFRQWCMTSPGSHLKCFCSFNRHEAESGRELSSTVKLPVANVICHLTWWKSEVWVANHRLKKRDTQRPGGVRVFPIHTTPLEGADKDKQTAGTKTLRAAFSRLVEASVVCLLKSRLPPISNRLTPVVS